MGLGRVIYFDENNNVDNTTIYNAFAKFKGLC